jgi:hypothetical protein
MLNVALVSTEYLLLVISSVRNIRQELVGKCIAVAVTSVGVAEAELKGAGGVFVFKIGALCHTHLGPYPVEIGVTYTCHCWGS